jgi:AcrR family transcriptional regulator
MEEEKRLAMKARRAKNAAGTPAKFQAGAELRARVIEAAAHLFAEKGYEQVSLRRIASEVGCSQMAMYRHFPDKDALIRHVCAELYARFTSRLQNLLARIPEPGARLEELACQFVEFAVRHPNHYRLTFVTPYPDAKMHQARESIAGNPTEFLQENLRQILPVDAADAEVDARMYQILACMHGMTVMLIERPRARGLTKEAAVRELPKLVRQIYSRPA